MCAHLPGKHHFVTVRRVFVDCLTSGIVHLEHLEVVGKTVKILTSYFLWPEGIMRGPEERTRGPPVAAPLWRTHPPPASLSRARCCQSIRRVMSLIHRWYLLVYLICCQVSRLCTIISFPHWRDLYIYIFIYLLWCFFFLASRSLLCRCHVWAVSMAENHLEYGYLEGESIGEHFAEDPVGIVMFV